MRRVERAKDAADHADRAVDWWTETAVLQLASWAAREPRDAFLVEDARLSLEALGIPPAPDERAWGHVAREAQRRGLIRRVGYRQARDGSPKSLWVPA